MKAGTISLDPTGRRVDYYSTVLTDTDDELKLADIPFRATYPLEVEGATNQFGCGVVPKVRTAVPVARRVRVQ
jgi:hypothetical protein